MIIFLYGEDTYRSRKKLNELKAKYRREVDSEGGGFSLLDGEFAKMRDINDQVGAVSLFVRKRMAVIENIFRNKDKDFLDELKNYLEKRGSQTGNIIIFWDEAAVAKNKLFKYLSSLEFAYEFKKLSNTEAMAWARKEAAADGAVLRQQAAAALTAIFGNDLWHIKNELDKIINYKKALLAGNLSGQQAIIEESDIGDLCRGKTDENIFALTDAISSRQKGRALELLEKEMESGMNETYLLFMVMRQYKILTMVRQSLDLGHTQKKLAADLKLHPFVAQKSVNQAHNYNLKTLANIFSALVRIDRRAKTGVSDIRTDLALLIARL